MVVRLIIFVCSIMERRWYFFFFFQAEDGIRDIGVTGVQTCALPIFGFTVIGALKLASAFLLAAAGFGIFRLLGSDLGQTLEGFVSRLHLDPESRYIHAAISWASGIDPKHLEAIACGTFFSAALHLVEGVGLLLQ